MSQLHQILVGDCIEMMRTLPDQCVQTCVTSPPYFGLRDYGMAAQIGLEDTPAEFIARLVDVFREVRRVLRDDGTLWLNLGDSYSANRGSQAIPSNTRNKSGHVGCQRVATGMKPKDLIGIPWLAAFALRADGWYLRQDIIWQKPNCMPSSVTDRCTSSHEHIFLLAKSDRYFFDNKAIQEDAVSEHQSGNGFKRPERLSYQNQDGTARGNDAQWSGVGGPRNKRDVWSVPVKAFGGAHFATFPPDLIRPCILAGAPRGGVVLDPFGGAGTTSLVSMQEGRRSILCELNPEYAQLARARIDAAWLDGAAQMDVFHDAAPAA